MADLRAAAVVGTAVGLTEVAALVGAAWACVAGEPAGWPVWACAARGPAKVSSVTATAATTQSTTAAVAIAAPGWARMLAQLAHLTACENSAAQVDSARRTTRRR